MASPAVQRLTQRYYPGYRSESDLLDDAIRARLRPGRVLDIGCGGGRLFPNDYRAVGRTVVGIDLDPALRSNTLLDGRVFGSAETLPFRAASFDLVYSRYVFEHLARPQAVFAELARILRPGGAVVILTPNRNHYVPLVARLTPSWFHKGYNARVRGRHSDDTFPTLYRANTRRTLRALASAAGLEEAECRMVETKPNYLSFAALPFLLGVLYERAVNGTPALSGLRVNILATFVKPRAA